jgi:hypothetical protein
MKRLKEWKGADWITAIIWASIIYGIIQKDKWVFISVCVLYLLYLLIKVVTDIVVLICQRNQDKKEKSRFISLFFNIFLFVWNMIFFIYFSFSYFTLWH